MQYIRWYQPRPGFDRMLLACDDTGLTGAWFEHQLYFGSRLAMEREEKTTPVLEMAMHWLDIYFSEKEPDFLPILHFTGTPFQIQVWKLLSEIPYGETRTYAWLAAAAARARGVNCAFRAVGTIVSRNPFAIFVPCHRVISLDNSLKGHPAGLLVKRDLLACEGIDVSRFYIPWGTAL